MQQGHHLPWLLPVVCTHPESFRQVWSQRHQELDWHATCSYMTFRCSSPKIPRYGEFPCQPSCQSHTIISEQVPFQFLEPIAGNTHIYPSLPR
jgi:hypothetical protein